MLSLHDFREKRILVVISEKNIDHQIRFWNSNIRLYRDESPYEQISCHLVFSLFIIGNATLTTTLIQKAQQYGISIHLLNRSFRQYAEIPAATEGNTLIRRLQYTATSTTEFEMAKKLMQNKLRNQIILLKEYEHHAAAQDIEKRLLTKVQEAQNEKELLGLEGNASNIYFTNLFREIGWNRRAPQTREDIPNLLLDIGYSFLFNLNDGLLRLFGFDTFKGYYHKLFFQRKSLACDTMEPMRMLIDKALIKAYRLSRISNRDFRYKNGSFEFKPGSEIRKKYSSIFFSNLLENRESIYAYIREHYLHVANRKKYPLPEFTL